MATPHDQIKNVVESRINVDHFKIANKMQPHIEHLARLGYNVTLSVEDGLETVYFISSGPEYQEAKYLDSRTTDAD